MFNLAISSATKTPFWKRQLFQLFTVLDGRELKYSLYIIPIIAKFAMVILLVRV